MGDNITRQNRGEESIRYWKDLAGEDQHVELGDEDVIDLITDALHFASSRSMDVEAILRMAKFNHEAEAGEPT